MTSLQTVNEPAAFAQPRPLRPWPALVRMDKAPAPKPLVMGHSPQRQEPLALTRVQTRWQPESAPRFTASSANDPVQKLADEDRTGLTLLALVMCVTVAIALLGFGMQMMQ